MVLIVPLAAFLCGPVPGFAGTVLGTAQNFAVLGATTVTSAGMTAIYGNLGLYSGASITGFGPGVVTGGTTYTTDATAHQAQIDALTAYNTLAGLPYNFNYSGDVLGSTGYTVLVPGVYHFATSAQLTGTVILDFSSDPAGSFVFEIGTTLTTAVGADVEVINGGSQSSVYWQVGTSATLGAGTVFAGNILADQSITMNAGADILSGRAIALSGAVTLSDNEVSDNAALQNFGSSLSDFGSLGFSGGSGSGSAAPEPGTIALFGASLGTCLLLLRKMRSNPL
jgi:type VI secretion system secreted protein VgrG